jgi:hypothetical protein
MRSISFFSAGVIGPEAPAHWNLRPHVFNALFGQLVPSSLQSALQHAPHGCRRGRLFRVFPRVGEGTFISVHHLFEHESRRHARQTNIYPDRVVRTGKWYGRRSTRTQTKNRGGGTFPEVPSWHLCAGGRDISARSDEVLLFPECETNAHLLHRSSDFSAA